MKKNIIIFLLALVLTIVINYFAWDTVALSTGFTKIKATLLTDCIIFPAMFGVMQAILAQFGGIFRNDYVSIA